MNRVRWVWRCALLTALGLTFVAARGEPPGKMNRLTGVVVFREDGKPAANMPVLFSHGHKGYIYLMDGGLQGRGEDTKILGFFTKRNSMHFCQTMTDGDGRFTLENFAAPDEGWNIMAGDSQKGFALQIGILPKDYAGEPLKLEIDKPAFVKVTLPTPTGKTYPLGLGLAMTLPKTAAEPARAVTSDEEAEERAVRVFYWSQDMWNLTAGKVVRIGPLPAGATYSVTATMSKPGLSYQPMVAARTVVTEAGQTKDLSLAASTGAALTGRVTDNDDKALANVNVKIEAADGVILGALTDDDGKYDIRGVPAGTHQLELLRHAARRVPG